MGAYFPRWWEYLALLIGLILLIWFGACRVLVPSLDSALSRGIIHINMTAEELMSGIGLQNGDLIFLAGNTQGERAIKLFHNSYYSHVCLVFRDERGAIDDTPKNTIFVWESDLGQGYRSGPRVMRLWDKLQRWGGRERTASRIGMWKRFISIPEAKPTATAILDIAKPYIDAKVDMDITMSSWFLADYPDSAIYRFLKGNGLKGNDLKGERGEKGNALEGKKIFCSELLAATLQTLGIMSKEHHPSWFTPESFASGKGVTLKKGAYGSPIYFAF